MQDGRWAGTLPCNVFGPQTQTTTTESSAIELGDRGTARLALTVVAVAGVAPTLDVALQTRHDATDPWRSLGAFAQATAPGTERKCFVGLDRFIRAIATIGVAPGASSFTFSVDGEAV
jgi:hypothetical protein